MASKMATNGHVIFFFIIIGSNKFYINVLTIFCESCIAIGRTVLEIHCIEPIYPQYSRVLETGLALGYWFFEVLGSENVKPFKFHGVSSQDLYH